MVLQVPTRGSSCIGRQITLNLYLWNVNTSWNSSLLGKTFTSLASRAFCSKPDNSDPVTQSQANKLPESNLTKVVFKYVCANDESRPFVPLITEVLETPRGNTYIAVRQRDDVTYVNLIDFCYSYLMQRKEDAESNNGERVSEISCIDASFFAERIRSIIDSAGDLLNESCMIRLLSQETEDCIRSSKMSGTGCKLTIDLDVLFDIRIWEKIASGDKHVLEIIVNELKKHGFDFTEDPVALRKIEEAVERAMTRTTNVIKLNLPVPAGKPDMSTTISWGKCAGLPILRTITPEIWRWARSRSEMLAAKNKKN
ncbi:hypothetical protein MKW94_004469 [Papaver nudicaule]|uniref:Uncharacterized protein n=1 Tax=Papaver nudicaule TaxID=74823 RepID=A0AA41VA06_PAPNU|nr:hypothetical protein [Papaver nudicaule]